MTVNTSSFLCFKRETTAGTAIITAVNTPTSFLGKYSKELREIQAPTVENTAENYYDNTTRNPTIVFGNKEYPVYPTSFHPCSPMGDFMFLGEATEAATSTIQTKATGKKEAYDLRHEEREGTNQLRQAVGSWCVGIENNWEANKDMITKLMWVFQDIEDNGDRSSLTTLPVIPEGIATAYTGKPTVTWDVGGGGEVTLPEIWKVKMSTAQNLSINELGDDQEINLHEYQPVRLLLVGLLRDNNQWDALKDKTTHDINVKVYKGDTAQFATWKFDNGKVLKLTKVGKTDEGLYLQTIELTCEKYTVEWVDEWGANFADWM